MAQIETGGNEGHGKKGGKKRAKKLSTRIDMTPMVDLAFLLLTFFVLTSTFSKPKVLRMIFPEKQEGPVANAPKVKDGLTLLVTKDNRIFHYSGDLASATDVEETNFGKDGLRKILRERNRALLKRLAEIQKVSDKADKNDTAAQNKIVRDLNQAQAEAKFVVLVKHDEGATYEDMINVVDEFLITQVAKYFVVDEGMDAKEKAMVAKKLNAK